MAAAPGEIGTRHLDQARNATASQLSRPPASEIDFFQIFGPIDLEKHLRQAIIGRVGWDFFRGKKSIDS
jgi:hypothetical protein